MSCFKKSIHVHKVKVYIWLWIFHLKVLLTQKPEFVTHMQLNNIQQQTEHDVYM